MQLHKNCVEFQWIWKNESCIVVEWWVPNSLLESNIIDLGARVRVRVMSKVILDSYIMANRCNVIFEAEISTLLWTIFDGREHGYIDRWSRELPLVIGATILV